MPSPFPGMNPYIEQPGVWGDFHNRFITAAADVIGAQVLPRYFVMVNEQVYLHEPPADERVRVGRPDLSVHTGTGSVVVGSPAGTAAAGWVGLPSDIDVERVGYLEIKDRLSRGVVTVVELLSPSNKSGDDRGQYLAKTRQVMRSGASLVEVDLLRGGPRMPWAGLPAGDYHAVVSRPADRAASPPRAQVWTARLRDRLPEVPIPLRPGEPEAALDIQAVLHQVYDRAGYATYIYQSPPEPRLAPDDAAWAAAIVSPPA